MQLMTQRHPHRRLDLALPQPPGEGRRRRRGADACAAVARGGPPAGADRRHVPPGRSRTPPTSGSGGRQVRQGRARRLMLCAFVIEAVLFDGDQTLWDFERVMRDALIGGGVDELRTARPGAFTDALAWEDLEGDRAAVGEEWDGDRVQPGPLAGARVRPDARAAAGGRRRCDASGDEALTLELSDSYFAHRDRDPALFRRHGPVSRGAAGALPLGFALQREPAPRDGRAGRVLRVVVFAQDHRVAKPDKAIFEIVETPVGLAPGGCVLVGDHLVNDVAAPRRRLVRPCGSIGTGSASGGSPTRPARCRGRVARELPAALEAMEAGGRPVSG